MILHYTDKALFDSIQQSLQSGKPSALGENFVQDAWLESYLPWRMSSPDGRLDLEFTPFVERVAKTNLLLIASEVHQMFGRYRGAAIADDGEVIHFDGLIGRAEEHHARW